MSEFTPSTSAPVTGRGAYFREFAFALPAVLLFAQSALSDIRLPGIYFDAVNPDYMALRLFALQKGVPAFTIPGQMIFNTFPVLIHVYHGALPFYFGLPIYFLFGMDEIGVRVANFVFGVLVLLGLAAALRAFRVRPLVAGAALAAVALDPGFVFDFRTQYYITTLPLALYLTSIAITERRADEPHDRSSFVAGLLTGLSVYGYFFYAFLAPIAAIHAVWRRPKGASLVRGTWPWFAGGALGVGLYALGLGLVVLDQHGVAGAITFFRGYFQDLAVIRPLSFADRLSIVGRTFESVVYSVGPIDQITYGWLPYARKEKEAILFAAPLLALALALVPPRRIVAPVVLWGVLAGFAALFLAFGNRAGLHHAAPMLPTFYFGAAFAVDRLIELAPGRALLIASRAFAALVLGLLIFYAGVDRQHAFLALERTGGVGMYSDAMLRFADDALSEKAPTQAFMPDWGFMLPFEMKTGGMISTYGAFRADIAKEKLCAGLDAFLAIYAMQQPERIDEYTAALGGPAPEVRTYRQRDGAPVVITARWRSATYPPDACHK